MIRRFLIATLLLLAATSAQAGFYTDIWYRKSQPGFGYNLVQTDNFIFVTFFIYGPDSGKPTWYIAQLQQQGDGSFAGELSETRGTFWAVPWVPGNLTETVVGTARFTPSGDNAYEGTFSYTVPGVGTSTNPIERQTLLSQDLKGDYAGGAGGQYSGCTDPNNNGAYRDYYDLTVTQLTASDATLQFDYVNGLSCTLSGALVQNGLLYRMPNATYACQGGGGAPFQTSAQMFQIKWTAQGIEGQFFAPQTPGGCQEFGYFSAVIL
jgi:hypothetical protein